MDCCTDNICAEVFSIIEIRSEVLKTAYGVICAATWRSFVQVVDEQNSESTALCYAQSNGDY